MKWKERNQRTIENLATAIARFWFSAASFLLTALFAMYSIETGADQLYRLVACLVAGVVGMFTQLLYERFYREKKAFRLIFYLVSFIFSIGYYFYLEYTLEMQTVVFIRTWVLVFILYIGSMWVPSLKQMNVTFSKSFVAFFKAHFTSLLLSFVLAVGTCMVLGTFHFLIMEIEYTLYFHILAFIWFAFFPVYTLSLLPVFPSREAEESEKYIRAISVPKFLEVLLSYIVVPLIVAYTLILLLYILTNITGEFWNDNLLEPLLVSYAVTGWVTLFLIESVETDSARLFKLHFPKLLVVVVFF